MLGPSEGFNGEYHPRDKGFNVQIAHPCQDHWRGPPQGLIYAKDRGHRFRSQDGLVIVYKKKQT